MESANIVLEPEEKEDPMTQPFKTQREVFEHLVKGEKVKHIAAVTIVFIKDDGMLNIGNLCYCNFEKPNEWRPYIEPKPQVKVWRWERRFVDEKANPSIEATNNYYVESTVRSWPDGHEYTKVEGSERTIEPTNSGE